MSNPYQIITRAISAYGVRCWRSGLRCPCGCMCRVPWTTIKAMGFNWSAPYWCKAYQIHDEILAHRIPLEEFRSLVYKYQFHLVKHVDSVRHKIQSWGDEYVATLLSCQRLSAEYRLPKGNRYALAWATFMDYKLTGMFPKTVAVMEQWPHVKGIPPQHIVENLLWNYPTAHNPSVRTILGDRRNAKVAAAAVAKVKYSCSSLLMSLVRSGFQQKITKMQWILAVFWTTIVMPKLKAWKSSHTLYTKIPYTPSESLSVLLRRSPTHVPRAAYTLSTTIHKDPKAFLQLTFLYWRFPDRSMDNALIRWIRFIASSKSADSERALNKIWRTCSRSNTNWYFTFANLLLDAPVTHNRLLLSVLHQSLSRSTQFSIGMNSLFWKCMRSSRVQPKIVAKFLFISNLRNTWQAEEEHTFRDFLWMPAIQANIHTQCVCKELTHYLNSTMVILLANMENRDRIQQALWESISVQKWYTYLQETYTRQYTDFLQCIPARWRAKKERRRRREIALVDTPVFRTLAIRSSYKWRKLQGTCPICMEDKTGSMIPLHMEMRHGVCRECRDSIVHTTNCCPICRVSLANIATYEVPMHDERYYEENHYEYADEDADYDDDQAYHYD